MAIQIICPGCHKRFKVSDKFAGKTGPCPECKTPIQIPLKSEELQIHAPEEFGPKGVSGESVLKPIARQETRLTAPMIAGIVGAVLLVPIVALVLRFVFAAPEGVPQVPTALLGGSAFLLGPLLAWAGYTFLRDQELEPYRGQPLVIRVLICGLVYGLLWGLYVLLCSSLVGVGRPEIFHLAFLIPALMVPGTLAAHASLDLDLGSAAMHYGMYLLGCVLLRLIIGLPAF